MCKHVPQLVEGNGNRGSKLPQVQDSDALFIRHCNNVSGSAYMVRSEQLNKVYGSAYGDKIREYSKNY